MTPIQEALVAFFAVYGFGWFTIRWVLEPARELLRDDPSTGTEQEELTNLDPEAVANQVEKITERHAEDLSGYEKTWLQNAADYLRHLNTGGDRS